MKHSIPRSPFATRLSGSARETEIRIRNLFQGPKKRPPILIIILTALVILSCGWLVSCQPKEEVPSDSSSPSNAPDSSVEDQALLETLYGAVSSQMNFVDYEGPHPLEDISSSLLNSYSQAGYTLGAATFQDAFSTYLVIGSVENATGALTGPAYISSARGGVPHTVSFTKDGGFHLLYSLNNMGQSYIYGASGVIRLAEGKLAWLWPVEGDILEEGSQARADYDAYWEEHLALLSPGGVEIFAENKDYVPYAGSPVQWSPESSQQFYPAPEDDLPIGTLWNVRNWLEEFTRDSRNPWDASNISASWQIVSLTPADGVYHDAHYGGKAEYVLVAHAWDGSDQWFTASVILDHSQGQVERVTDWLQGTREEVSAYGYPLRDAEAVSALPLPEGQPLELMFCSGAGAWSTLLTLNPDGSFDGTYHDSDMGVSGEGFPNGTVYLCTFRGRFGDIKKLDDSTYAMTLQELTITTPHAVGEEWIEDGVRYVSSEAYGLNGGTEFFLYTPEAPISDLSQSFLTWFSGPYDRSALAEDSSLGHYGLYNKSMGYGFFS